jgi:CRP-like cAMP-binding protein
MERYMKFLDSYEEMPAEMKKLLEDKVQRVVVKKGDIVREANRVADHSYFIEKGLFRLFVDKAGRRLTVRFKKEDDFISSLKRTFTHEAKMRKGIEALEDGILWAIPDSVSNYLYDNFEPFRTQWLGLFLEEWSEMNNSYECHRPNSGPKNFDNLLRKFPYLVERVPIPYLADYTRLTEKTVRRYLGAGRGPRIG